MNRYNIKNDGYGIKAEKNERGTWVLYESAQEEIEELKAKIKELQNGYSDI